MHEDRTLVGYSGHGVQVEADPGRAHSEGLAQEQALPRCTQRGELPPVLPQDLRHTWHTL